MSVATRALADNQERKTLCDSDRKKFSHMQWYLHHSENIVFMAAESSQSLSDKTYFDVVDYLIQSSPQIHFQADNSGDYHCPKKVTAKPYGSLQKVENLSASLKYSLDNLREVYDSDALANVRSYGFTAADNKLKSHWQSDRGSHLRSPPNAVRSYFVFSAAHALMEGAASSRSLSIKTSQKRSDVLEVKIGKLKQFLINIAGLLLAPMHLLASRFNKRDCSNGQWFVIDLDRSQIKKIARAHHVRQRSVLFSLPLFGLHLAKGLANPATKKKQLVSYSTLPKVKTDLDDEALLVRLQVGQFPSADHFADHIKAVDKVLSKENTTEIYSQAFYNSILGVHRKIQKWFPGLYGQKFFTYIPYDFVLSLVPPHLANGPLKKIFDGAIFCGSYTPGVNSCIITPHRNGISFSMYLDQSVYGNIDGFLRMLESENFTVRRII